MSFLLSAAMEWATEFTRRLAFLVRLAKMLPPSSVDIINGGPCLNWLTIWIKQFGLQKGEGRLTYLREALKKVLTLIALHFGVST